MEVYKKIKQYSEFKNKMNYWNHEEMILRLLISLIINQIYWKKGSYIYNNLAWINNNVFWYIMVLYLYDTIFIISSKCVLNNKIEF